MSSKHFKVPFEQKCLHVQLGLRRSLAQHMAFDQLRRHQLLENTYYTRCWSQKVHH